jgi:hypothetical protein
MPSFLRSFSVGVAGLLAAAAAGAQSLPAGVQLGMSPAELQAALPDAQRVTRPQRLAGGLAGTWRGASTAIAGLNFEPTFYFAGAELRRVEWLAVADALPDHGASAFDALLGWGRGRFGNELSSRDPGSRYAAWVAGDTDVYAQLVDGERGASVRLVYKARQLKDASEL